MNPDTFCEQVFHHMPCSAVTCKVFRDENSHVTDFRVTAINEFLRGLLNMNVDQWIGKRASEYLGERTVRLWSDRFGTAIGSGEIGHYEEFVESLHRRCTVTIFPIAEDECTVMFVMN